VAIFQGAFALFGPSQFQVTYPEVTKPLHGVLHFAGEACSVYHAWVVGALDSAYNALLQIVCLLPLIASGSLLTDTGSSLCYAEELILWNASRRHGRAMNSPMRTKHLLLSKSSSAR